MIYINGVAQVGVGDMTKAVYDANEDGKIALEQLVAAVCSDSELATGISDHAGIADAHHAKTSDNEVYGLVQAGTAAGRPAAGVAGRWYFSTDTLVLERDTGAAWVEMARGETAIRLAQLAERAHSSLTGIGASDHHAKTVIGDLSPIAESDLNLDQGTQALFDKIVADIATHAGLDTGVHGVGASTVCSETEAVAKVTFENLDAKGDVGPGAAQVAKGDHTHTLVDDTTGSDIFTGEAHEGVGDSRGEMITAGADKVVASKTLTFASTSRAVAVGFINANGGYENELKLQLLMGGTKVAESAYLDRYGDNVILLAIRALSGSQQCKIQVHNYKGEGTICRFAAGSSNRPGAGAIGVGSVKV